MARNHETTKHGFILDRDRLKKVVLEVYDSVEKRKGIFRDGYQHFLPQWNLPKELEYSPIGEKPFNTEGAAKFLWVRNFCDRLSQSSHLTETTLATWHNPDVNWIYNPFQVKEKDEEQIANVLRNHLHFGLNNEGKEEKNEWRFSLNAYKLVNEYDGDPRNIINYNTVKQSRENLMEFSGIGTGLANLFIIQMYERGISIPRDPENVLLKIDRHKAGIAVYTGAVIPINGEIEQNSLVSVLEEEYKKISLNERLDSKVLDAALWITGSEVCTEQSYTRCLTDCVLSKSLCISRVPLSQKTGRYEIFDSNGDRQDTRKERTQRFLFEDTYKF